MTKKTSSILYSVGISVLLIGFAAIYILSAGEVAARPCTQMRVQYADEGRFVDDQDVRDQIEKVFGEFMSRRIDSLDIYRMESAVQTNEAVKKCEAWISDAGILNVRVYQRRPVVRFQSKTEGFYADRDATVFPLQDKYTEKVLVVEGTIDKDDSEWIGKVVGLVNYLADSKWSDTIIQIHSEADKSLVLIPAAGQERFLIGHPDRIEEKFSMMEKYYKNIVPLGKNYKTINLKYAGQIICK